MQTRVRCLLFLVITTLAAIPLLAQVDTGTIQGTVKDQSGAVVPNVKVTLTNQGTGLSFATTSAADGAYIFTPIKIGIYTVAAEFSGFQKFEHRNVEVQVQQKVLVDVTLTPGQLTQTVEVTSAAPTLQTQDASVGQTVGQREVNDLPLNGRNYTFLAQLSAGVSFGQQDTRGEDASGNFTANGTRPAQNDYLLDGIDNNSNLYDFLNGTNYVVRPPIDAIQEFKIQTGNFSAELGRAAGGVLNATIKSGTNKLHGDVWEFLRNDKLDAANFFENSGGIQKGEYRLNQFGGTLGGPIDIPHIYNGKNKTFFFADYEGTRIRQGTPWVASVPTALERSSGFTNFSELISDQAGPGATRTDLLGRTTPLGTILDPSTTRNVTCGAMDPVSGITPAGAVSGDPCFGVAAGSSVGFTRDPFYTGASLAGITDFTSAAQVALLNQLPGGRLDSNAIKLLNVFPSPNGGGLFNNYTSSPPIKDTINQFDARIDHNFSDRDQMFGRVSYSDEPTFIPGPFTGLADGGAFNDGAQTAASINNALSETHSFSPTLINEARLGYTRIGSSRETPSAHDLTDIPAQYGIPGIPQIESNGGLPAFVFEGLNTLGTSAYLPSVERNQTVQFTDNLTKVYGAHNFKGGFEYQRIRLAIEQPAWSRGDFQFDGVYTEVPSTSGGNTGLAQLLLTPIPGSVSGAYDNVGGADQMYATNINYANMGRSYYSAYFQDDWKVNSKLTINLGIRWERHGQFAENTGAEANLLPGPPGSAQFLLPASRCKGPFSTSFNQLTATDGISIVCTNNTSLNQIPNDNFAPRVGMALRITPKLVMRAGYGLFYGGFENAGLNKFDNYPFSLSYGFFSPDAAHPITYSNGLIGTIENGFNGIEFNPTTINAEGLGFDAEQYLYRSPYTNSYNFSLQYQLTPNQTFQVAFVGNGARHLQTYIGNNQASVILPPGLNPQNYVPYPDFARGYPYYAEEGNSYYNSLQSVYERRFSHGLDVLANYTYSKCRTDASDNLNATAINFRAPWLPGFGIKDDYGLCDYDIRQIVHLSGGYALPFGKGKRFLRNSSGVVDNVLGGWQTNWILTLQDGQPFTIGCPLGTTADFGCTALKVPGQNPDGGPHNVNHWLNPAAYANPLPATTIGQTDFSPLGGNPSNAVGPGFHRMDFSMFKEFRTTEKTHLEFRAEVFNLTNHPNFSYPGFGGNGIVPAPGSTDFTSPATFGTINSTRDGQNDQREIQFALKFYF